VPRVPKGAFAIPLKLHHCAVDGMESVEVMLAMHDLASDSPRPDPPESPLLAQPFTVDRKPPLSNGDQGCAVPARSWSSVGKMWRVMR
jgi:hypothetical protein